MRIVMIGAGYVGLVSGACLADFGHHVVCIDKDKGKIAALRDGQIPIYEPGLSDLVGKNANEGRLSFETELSGPVSTAAAAFIAVGTPFAPRRRPCGPLLRLRSGTRDRASA